MAVRSLRVGPGLLRAAWTSLLHATTAVQCRAGHFRCQDSMSLWRIGGGGAAANRSDASRVRFSARAALDAWRGKTASSYRGGGPGDIASSPTVLVVDDEPMVRSVMVAALRDHYRVVAAADGLEALDVFRAAEGEITALVTDVARPKLDGLGLAAELRRLDDPPPILFVSGFTGRDEIPAPFLQKPFDPQALLAAVRQAINSRNE